MNSDQRASNQIDVSESYGMASKKEVMRSNYGLTERIKGEEQVKSILDRNHVKSKSILSKHLSSRVDKNSIDFDDIQPIN
jgi:hypothetical protein